MHHSHRSAVGSCHHIDFLIGLRQFFFQHYHREGRCAGRHIAGAFTHRVGGNHPCAGITLGRAERHPSLQFARHIKQRSTFGGEATGLYTGCQHTWKNLLETERQFAIGEYTVENPRHTCGIITCGRVNRQHSRSVAHTEHFLSG